MTRDRIGVGVVGVGIMGRRHAENAAWWIPGGRLGAVFDADRALASRVGRDLEAEACGSLEELLGRDDVRIVVIASPREFHAEQAVAALSQGKDVLLEKPMALSLADCDRVIAAAEQGSARLQIGFMRRYDAAYAEARRLVLSGALGDALLVRAVHRDRAELADFVDGSLERRPPAVTGRDGRAAVAAALAGVASFKSGRAEPVAG